MQCLTYLLFTFATGLLLKTQATTPNSGIGLVLVVALVAVILAAFVLAITEFRIGLRHLKKVSVLDPNIA